MRTLRLAVLLCDEIVMRVVRNDYGKIFCQFLSSSLKLITSEVTLVLDEFDVVHNMAYPPDNVQYDGILISGSRMSVNDELEWSKKLMAYVKRIVTEKPSVKIFGICFGHQIIAKALGAEVKRGEWEVSVTNIYLSRVGKAIFRSDRLKLQLIHHDQVLAPPRNAYLLGVSEDVDNQGYVIFNRGENPLPAELEAGTLRAKLSNIHVLTLQGHPEVTELVMRKLIHDSETELGQALVEDALARVGQPTDALDTVGEVIWGVLGVGSR